MRILRSNSKLQLHKVTLRQLSGPALRGVLGRAGDSEACPSDQPSIVQLNCDGTRPPSIDPPPIPRTNKQSVSCYTDCRY